MEAKDLMIGDWVLYRNTPRKVVYINDRHLRELHNNEIGFTSHDDEWIAAHNAEPIHLTDEILKANGFERECCVSRNSEYKVSIHHWNANNNVLTSLGKEKNPISIPDLVYVHELQHALRLCGLNELADNFIIEKGGKNEKN